MGNYIDQISKLNIKDFVYIDETGIGKGLIETLSWTRKGKTRNLKIMGKRLVRTNVIAAKTSNGIEAQFIFDGACNTLLFEAYIEKNLCPILRIGQIVVLDNASIHKSQKTRDLIEKRGCKLIFLPPYSPDLNPIEQYWAVLKKYIKKISGIFENRWDCIEYAILETMAFGLS